MARSLTCAFCSGEVHALPHGDRRLLHCTFCQTRRLVPAIVAEFPTERGRLLRRIAWHRWILRKQETTRTASVRRRIREDWELLSDLRARFIEAQRLPLMEEAA
jgi:hypothetical protein